MFYLPGLDKDITTPDKAAEELTTVIRECIHAVGRSHRTRGKSAPGWTEEYQQAWKNWRQSDEDNLLGPARREFLSIVRAAKRQYWRQHIDNIRSDKDMIRIVNCQKGSNQIRAPPLTNGDRTIENTGDKARYLAEAVLQRFTG